MGDEGRDEQEAISDRGAPRSFSDYVRQRRDELGLTQEEAAKKADVSPSTWRKFESGETKGFRTTTLADVARALDLDVAEFFMLAGVDESARLRGEGEPTSQRLNFSDAFRSWRDVVEHPAFGESDLALEETAGRSHDHDIIAWQITKSLNGLPPDDLRLIWLLIQRLRHEHREDLAG